MAQVIVRDNIFDHSEKTVHRIHDGEIFIDWLKKNYKNGFDSPSVIFLNGKKIEVKNYDFEVSNLDVVEICPNVGDPGIFISVLLFGVVGGAAAYTFIQLLPDPEIPTSLSGRKPSPTYSVRAQSNSARIGEPIPVIYGRQKLFPDLAAQPWFDYENNDQFLHQLHCIGHGEFEILDKDIKIGNSKLSNYVNVTKQIVQPGELVTLFEDNMVTAPETSDLELLGVTQYKRSSLISNDDNGFRMSKADRRIRIRFPNNPDPLLSIPWNSTFNIGDSVTLINFDNPAYEGTFTVQSISANGEDLILTDVLSWPAGNSVDQDGEIVLSKFVDLDNNDGFTGIIPLCPVGTIINRFHLDIEFPDGLFDLDNNGDPVIRHGGAVFVFGLIDNEDNFIGGGPTSGGNFDHFLNTRNVFRVSRAVPGAPFINPGRYGVQIKHLTGYPKNLDFGSAFRVILRGVRGQLQNVQRYGQLTMLAIKIKATNQLNSSLSKKVNVVVTRKLPIWNGSSWDLPVATRSIAWAIADIWMANYGGSRSFCNLDLDALLALEETWNSRGGTGSDEFRDFFDATFDQQVTVWEALTRAARVGRAKPVLSRNVLTIVREQLRSTRTSMFNTRNIIKDSLSIDYSFDDNRAPDGVRLKYLDDVTFKEEVVQPKIETNTDATRPKEVTLFGCTRYEQAFREALYMNAALKLQKRKMTFETELDGHIPMFGDRIAISHFTPNWGISGEVLSVNGLELTLSEPVDFTVSGPFVVILRKKNGSVDGPITCIEVVSPNNNKILLDTAPSFTIQTELNLERTYFSFGNSVESIQDVIVTEIEPRGNKRVKVSTINYDPAVHTADTVTIPPKSGIVFPLNPIAPVVTGLLLSNVANSGVVVAKWNPASISIPVPLNGYRIETSPDNNTWVLHAVVTTLTTDITATGLLYVRVAAILTATVGEFTTSSITAS